MNYARVPESEAAIETAARHVASGGLLVHPTTGVYGIGGRHAMAVETAVARLKERAAGAVLIYLVDGEAGARRAFPHLAWEPPATVSRLLSYSNCITSKITSQIGAESFSGYAIKGNLKIKTHSSSVT